MLDAQTISCKGRLIGPNHACFPDWDETIHASANLRRFSGHQADPSLDWNLLKHNVAVGILCGEFVPGNSHDQVEILTNDTPTPYKTPQQRQFEKDFTKIQAEYFEKVWPGYKKEYILESKYKPADAMMMDVESEFVIKCPPKYKKIFKYDEKKYGVKFDRKKVVELFHELEAIPTDILARGLKTYMKEFANYCQRYNYSAEMEERTSRDFLDIFNVEHIVKERFNNIDRPRPRRKDTDYYKKEEISWSKIYLLLVTVWALVSTVLIFI